MEKNKIYQQRVNRIRKIMKADGLEMVLVYSNWKDYLYGVFLNGVKPLQYQYFFITAKEIGYLVPSYILQPYKLDVHKNSIGLTDQGISRQLADFVSDKKKIGIVGPAPAKHLKEIKSKLVFLDEQISLLMSEKSRDELKSIALAKKATETVLKKIEKQIKPGARLDLLAKEAEENLLESIDSLAFPVIVYSDESKKSILSSFGFPSKIAKKDVIMVDIGAEKNGLMSDLSRMFFVNSPELQKQYQLLTKAHKAAIKRIKIGTLTSIIPKIYEEEFDRVGLNYQSFNKEKMGRSVGFGLIELPEIGEGKYTKNRIKAGMAITIILKVKIGEKVVEMQDTLIFPHRR